MSVEAVVIPDSARAVLRVVIADDDAGVRAGIGGLIIDDDRLELVAEAADASEAIAACAAYEPDVVVLDVSMPEGGGERAAAEIRAAHPEIRIVVLTAHSDRRTHAALIAAGADLFLSKGEVDDLATAIWRAGIA